MGDQSPGKALAEFVGSTRESLGLTQREAASKANVSRTTWQQVEWGNGERARNMTLHAMAETLHVDPRILLALRDGVALEEVGVPSRSREDLIERIVQHCHWLRLEDLSLVERNVAVHAELRRRQRRDLRSTALGE